MNTDENSETVFHASDPDHQDNGSVHSDVEDDVSSVPSGPLSVLPGKRHMVPALAIFAIFYAVSSLGIRYSAVNRLSASGREIYGSGELWRSLTALAVHGDIVHLLSNGIVLVFFGWMLRAYFGFLFFPIISLTLGIWTNLVVTCLYDPSISVIGCSGMTHGMVSLWVVLYLKHDVDSRLPRRFLRAIGFVLIMMVPSAVSADVSYHSHLVGFLTGLVSGICMLPFAVVRDPS